MNYSCAKVNATPGKGSLKNLMKPKGFIYLVEETFPAHQPDFAKKNFEQGWTVIIGTLLKQYIAKKAAETVL